MTPPKTLDLSQGTRFARVNQSSHPIPRATGP
jgi:hypothetical protein